MTELISDYFNVIHYFLLWFMMLVKSDRSGMNQFFVYLFCRLFILDETGNYNMEATWQALLPESHVIHKLGML